jgi:hypothetical protein
MKITIPTNLNEITLKQYLSFKAAILNNQDEDFIKLALITVFCNVTLEDAIKISIKEFNEIALQVSQTLQQEPKFTQRFKLNGKEFGFIPNLDKITAGEYIDLDKYLQNEDTYDRAMSVLFRPVANSFKDLYNIEPYVSSETYRKELEDMPLDVALGSLVFFYNLSNELLKATRDYFSQQTPEIKLLEEVLQKNGVGINQFIQLLETASLSLEKLQHSTYIHS